MSFLKARWATRGGVGWVGRGGGGGGGEQGELVIPLKGFFLVLWKDC